MVSASQATLLGIFHILCSSCKKDAGAGGHGLSNSLGSTLTLTAGVSELFILGVLLSVVGPVVALSSNSIAT